MEYDFTALGIPKEYFGKENEMDLNIIKRKSISKTKEDVVFSFIGLEGTLKNNGTYEDVLKAMDKYSEEKFSQKELLDAINFIIQLIDGKENISNKELKEQGYIFIRNLKENRSH